MAHCIWVTKFTTGTWNHFGTTTDPETERQEPLLDDSGWPTEVLQLLGARVLSPAVLRPI